MRGDEARVIAVFRERLEEEGWDVRSEVDFCDLVAEHRGERLYVEAKGLTSSPGLDVDTMYGQLLRRMPFEEDTTARFAVVVPDRALSAALRVHPRVRQLLRIEVYAVTDDDAVSGPHA
jgi:hypothetical protein